MIKVSHEVPINLLEKSKLFNDYDYCLPHLLDENEDYKHYFLSAGSMSRYTIMDNSLHELGKAYDTDRLMYWIQMLNPNEFIVPDVWEDMVGSVNNAKEWINVKLPKGVEKVAVIQAKTLNEAFICTEEYKKLGYKKIAYSYGASYYNDICPHPNKDLGKALGRLYVITTLYNQKALTENDRVHLLGCSVPQEFSWYRGIKCIESLDTSNPIMAALEKMWYDEHGLFSKPTANMRDNVEGGENIHPDILDWNVSMFRKINNLK